MTQDTNTASGAATRFTKKPVTITASQWFKPGDHPMVEHYDPEKAGAHIKGPGPYGWIKNLERGHIVSPGDWIITGVTGEHYPCKPDIFAATYSRAALAPTPAQPVAEPGPTAGMNIAQRILHVGGRNNDAGYVEFGSTQAVEALVRQVLRDLPAATAQADVRVQELERENAALRDALQGAVSMAKDAHGHWDEDRDAKVGKHLLALAGANKGYDKRADAIHAALAGTAPASKEKEYAELRIVRVTNNLGVADWVTVEDAKAFADATHALRTGGKPLTHEQAKDLVSKYGNDPLHLVFQVEVWHGIAEQQGEKP